MQYESYILVITPIKETNTCIYNGSNRADVELFEPYTVSRINDKSLSSRNQEEQIKLTSKPNEKITNHVSATKGYHKNTIYIWDPPDRSLNQVFILDQISSM